MQIAPNERLSSRFHALNGCILHGRSCPLVRRSPPWVEEAPWRWACKTEPCGSARRGVGCPVYDPALRIGEIRTRREETGKGCSTVTATSLGTAVPTGPDVLVVPEPPELVDGEGAGHVLASAIPMLGSFGSLAVVASLSDSASQRGPLATGSVLLAMLAFVVVQVDRQHRQRARRIEAVRETYLSQLAAVRSRLLKAREAGVSDLLRHHPSPSDLAAGVRPPRRAEQPSPRAGPAHPLKVRVGTSGQDVLPRLVGSAEPPGPRADPFCASASRRLLQVQARPHVLPTTVTLEPGTQTVLAGPVASVRGLARAMLCSAAAAHPPGELTIAVLGGTAAGEEWDWVKWLPHARSPSLRDAAGPRRAMTEAVDELDDLLSGGSARHTLVVIDPAAELPASPATSSLSLLDGLRQRGAHVIRLVADPRPVPSTRAPPTVAPGPPSLRLTQHRGEVTTLHRRLACACPGAVPDPCLAVPGPFPGAGPGDVPGTTPGAVLGTAPGAVPATAPGAVPGAGAWAEDCDVATAAIIARGLLAGSPPGGSGPRSSEAPDAAALLGFDPARDRPDACWSRRESSAVLRVSLGTDDSGSPVHLDLKEAARGGSGPHGLVIGATGSGKSELLRTLVVGLALTHSTCELNAVLVDFKGGATFAGLTGLPHVAATITNLSDDLSLVDRMHDALAGEMTRRQEVLREAGGLASAQEYAWVRSGRPELAPLPSLLVVVDEFSELLTVRPDLAELFAAIGRLGRSLGLHLLLASQRLEEGRLRGLESHLSYRIALRTNTAAESRVALGVPDAHALPKTPGTGILRTGPESMVRFRAACVSEPTARPGHPEPHLRKVLPFTCRTVPEVNPPPLSLPGPSLLERAVALLHGLGPPARGVWLPPLDRPESLDGLMPDLTVDPRLGLVSPRWRAAGPLVLPIGSVDRPREQRRDPLVVDLRGGGGHVAVVGGPRSGTSTALLTLVSALALTRTPEEARVYLVDLGGALGGLRPLPHVAGAAGRHEADLARRVVDAARAHLDRATQDRATQDRATQDRATKDCGTRGPEVFLVVDDWGTLRAELPDLEADLQALATRGLSAGVHLLVAARRWSDLRLGVRDCFGTRIELRLGDPADSELDRRSARSVPAGRPGRGLVSTGHHVLTCLPRVDGLREPGSLGAGAADLVARVRAAWPGEPPPRLLPLPTRVDLEDLPHGSEPADPGSVPLGLGERTFAPVRLDPAREPHLLVLGGARSGRTTALRTILRGLVEAEPPDRLQLVVVDLRRTLLGEVPEAHLCHHLADPDQARAALAEVATVLRARLPPPEVTAEELAQRRWWHGADCVVVVDDLELLSAATASPLSALLPLVTSAHAIGLRLLLAHNPGAPGRGTHDPVLQTLVGLSAPSLHLPGSSLLGPAGRPAATSVPGRARLVTGHCSEVLQVAWCPPRGFTRQ